MVHGPGTSALGVLGVLAFLLTQLPTYRGSRTFSNRVWVQSISTRTPRTLRTPPYWLCLCAALTVSGALAEDGTPVSHPWASHVRFWLFGQSGADMFANRIFGIPNNDSCFFEFGLSRTPE